MMLQLTFDDMPKAALGLWTTPFCPLGTTAGSSTCSSISSSSSSSSSPSVPSSSSTSSSSSSAPADLLEEQLCPFFSALRSLSYAPSSSSSSSSSSSISSFCILLLISDSFARPDTTDADDDACSYDVDRQYEVKSGGKGQRKKDRLIRARDESRSQANVLVRPVESPCDISECILPFHRPRKGTSEGVEPLLEDIYPPVTSSRNNLSLSHTSFVQL